MDNSDLSSPCDLGADWFQECLSFLREFRWIYDCQVTRFFVERVWEKIPEEWRGCLLSLTLEDLNLLPHGKTKDEWPETFCTFIQTALKMSVRRGSNSISPVDIPVDLKRGMNPKKQHEVALMTSLLHQLMRGTSVSTVVDVGAGLGYLGQVLQRVYGYRVISLECDDSRTHGAQQRSSKQGQATNFGLSLTFDLQDNTAAMNKFQSILNEIGKQRDLDPQSGSEIKGVKGGQIKGGEVKVSKTSRDQYHSEAGSKFTSVRDGEVNDGVKGEEVKDEVKVGEVKDEGVKGREVKDDEVKGGEVKDDEVKGGEVKDGKVKVGEVKDDEVKGGEVKDGKVKVGEVKDDEVKVGEVKDDGVKDDGVKVGEVKDDEVKDGEVKDDGIKVGEVKDDEVKGGEVKHDEVKVGEVKGQEVRGGEVRVCMTGLHCCGDLSPAMLRYFSRLDSVSVLASVSCCYHRMASHTDESGDTGMSNFPMSHSCQDALDNLGTTNQQWSLGTPAFRLAAQETRARWGTQSQADHDLHQRNVAYRGILELFCHEEKLTLTKITRKVALKKNHITFEDYLNAVFERVVLEPANGPGTDDVDMWKHKLGNIYFQAEDFFPYIEPFTALQVLLQPVLENLVYQDRRRFLQEQGFQAAIVSLFEETVSPRNLVLVASKHGNTISGVT